MGRIIPHGVLCHFSPYEANDFKAKANSTALFTPRDLPLHRFRPSSMLYVLISPLMHFNVYNNLGDQITESTRLPGKMAAFILLVRFSGIRKPLKGSSFKQGGLSSNSEICKRHTFSSGTKWALKPQHTCSLNQRHPHHPRPSSNRTSAGLSLFFVFVP